MIVINNTVLSNFRLTLEEGNTFLKAFIKHGYFSPVDRLDAFLQ